MPSEKSMWDKLGEAMREINLDPIRVENPAHPGTPDVNFVQGWVELKFMPKWPDDSFRPVRLPHPPQPQQKVWLARRWHHGGPAWLCLLVGNHYTGEDWLLFKGCDVRMLWQADKPDPSKMQLLNGAHFHAHHAMDIAIRLSKGRRV